MNESPPQDPRRRLRELLSVPERDRTDEQWDEIIELEITMAPGNRESDRPLSDRQPDRQVDKRPGASPLGRRPDQRKAVPRPAGPRAEPRPARPEPVAEAPAPDSRPVAAKRHTRRPRRSPETTGES